MLSKLRNIFGREAGVKTPIQILEEGLSLGPASRDLDRLVPVIVPLELLDLGWAGPICRIGQLPFCLAWTVCGAQNTFFHVRHEDAEFWEAAGVDWKAKASENLISISRDRPASGEKLDQAGTAFVKVMLHDDAVGPSRLLIPRLFERELGRDYQVAIPERTCAIAFRKKLSASEAADIDGMITGCFEHGTEPMSNDRFNSDDFWRLGNDCSFI